MGTVESWDGKRLFSTDAMCWDTGATVRAGEMYTVRLQVVKPWLTHNGMTPASPEGIEASRMPHLSGFAFIPFRRSLSGGWHQPFVTIAQGEARATQGLSFHASGSSYEATFEPVASGHVYLWVNDSVVGWTGLTSWSYQNNKGTALVRFDGASTVAAQAPP